MQNNTELPPLETLKKIVNPKYVQRKIAPIKAEVAELAHKLLKKSTEIMAKNYNNTPEDELDDTYFRVNIGKTKINPEIDLREYLKIFNKVFREYFGNQMMVFAENTTRRNKMVTENNADEIYVHIEFNNGYFE